MCQRALRVRFVSLQTQFEVASASYALFNVAVHYAVNEKFAFLCERQTRDGTMDSASDCCTIRAALASFESLAIIRSPKSLVDPGYIIDT